MKKKFIVIDGHHLIYRAYYAISGLSTSEGRLVNAIYWVASITLNIIEKEAPDYIAFTFDLYKSFRHRQDSEYKAQRKPCPEDLKDQMEDIYEMVKLMWIPMFAVEDFEADDVMWTIAEINSNNDNITTYIVSWDMDTMQLVSDEKVLVVLPNKWYKDPLYFDESKVFEKYELKPSQIVDFKMIAWDSSDNIKWIEWIGEVWARRLIKQYWSIEWIYNSIDLVKWKLKEKLINWKPWLVLWKDMLTIRRDVKIDDFTLEWCRFKSISKEVESVFKKYEFNSLIRRLDKLKPVVDLENQMSLF